MIAIVLGTRPEIIKMSPIIRACQELQEDHYILHTGQHYSYSMDKVFFEELELPEAKYNLEVGSGLHAEQTGKIMAGVENVLIKDRPQAVLVQGDTNTVMAAALAACKLGIKVGHVEAGLRSYDRTMPEEINRVVADHISDYLYAPTPLAKANLLSEGVRKGVLVTGNTVVDAVHQNRRIALRKSKALLTFGVQPGQFMLATAHRAENVDDPRRLRNLLSGLDRVTEEFGLPLVFPAHPRTRNRMKEFNLHAEKVLVTDPIGYLDFLQLQSSARLILTDSGGIQEEACILKVPCVTLRENTERPETLKVGSNMLAGTDPTRILKAARLMMKKRRSWRNPFGNGRTGKRIVEHLQKRH